MAAAMGMAFFSLSLGGTFMVIYGSYLGPKSRLSQNALFTGIGASLAGILAGLAIFPAVFSFGLEPSSGPDLIFRTLPETFDKMPAGWIFGSLFFLGLFGAAFLSDVAAFEVLVQGIVDNTRFSRRKTVSMVCLIVFFLALPPMWNFKIFVPWDLTFGSGMQALGSLLAVMAAVWFLKRGRVLNELNHGKPKRFYVFLLWWMRIVIPLAILFIGINWLLESVLHISLFGNTI
jgi:NSS family neurotransmitter:Na+ symporter